MKTLETGRLILRDWRSEDVNDMMAFYGNAEIMEAAGSHIVIFPEIAEAIIATYQESGEVWAIAHREENKVIGTMFLADIGRYEGYLEMEFILNGDYHNQGYMTEAVQAVLDYAFTEGGAEVVAVCHYPENLPSKRVIEKCGFRYEGTLRKYSRNGKDSVRYSMTAEDWGK